MDLRTQVEGARGDAASLEQLYRQALGAGDEAAFTAAIGRCAGEHPDDILLSAWAHRLGIVAPLPSAAGPEGQAAHPGHTRRWWTAVATSVVLGVLLALFAGDRPPFPVPGQASPLFWIGWGPLTAAGVLVYLGMVDRSKRRMCLYAGLAILPIALYTAVTAWNRTTCVSR